MAPAAVTNQYLRSLVSSFLGFRIKYTLKPLSANLRVGISGFGASVLLSRGRERGLVASMGSA